MIVIEIRGPGGCFDFHTELIKRALEKEGIELQMVIDRGKDMTMTNEESDIFLQECRDHMIERNITPFEVKIITHNQPWGG